MPRHRYIPGPVTVRGRHRSHEHIVEGEYSFTDYAGSNDAAARLNAYREATRDLQAIIKEAVDLKKEVRAQGSQWSLSRAGLAKDRLINTKALRLLRFGIPQQLTAGPYQGNARQLRFLECGESIFTVHKALRQDGLSLKTSGSNNGQTLAGALSTCTHGSNFGFGAIPDFVVGLHIVAGPNRHVYVQRQSAPVVKKAFADGLGAEFIEDDELFNAALVSFGSFGIIHGVMIEARDLFVLHATRFFHPFNDAIKKAAATLDVSDIDLSLSTLPADAPRDRPHHFQLYFNPNESATLDRVSVLMMFEDDWAKHQATYQTPQWDAGTAGPGEGALELIAGIIAAAPNLLLPTLNQQMEQRLGASYTLATLADMFRGEKAEGELMVTGTALPRDRWLEALEITFQTYRDHGTVLPVIISSRFVKGSRALLAFNKFENTCTIELDTIASPSSKQFLHDVRRNLRDAGIPFTVHWGKLRTPVDDAAKLRTEYGDAVPRWKQCRRALLESPGVEAVFSNDFMRDLELV